MSKTTFITVLYFLAISCAACGQKPNAPAINLTPSEIVAEVNGDKINRSSLATECLQLYGHDELEELINKTLIRLECERQKITVTADEVNAKILQMAQTFKLDSDKLLKVLEKERGISPEQYRQDIHWRLALDKLAGERLSISKEELDIELEKNYGVAVRVRQIVLDSKAKAEAVLAEVKQHPETFGSVAKNKSSDPVSQASAGMLHPIRRHTYNPNIEKMLFAMKPGDISPVVEYPIGHFTIFLCEGFLQPVNVDPAEIEAQLALQIRNEKLPQIANEIFVELKKQAKVQIVFGNPTLYQQYPNVAALLNGQVISNQMLADACIQKHGKDVLDEMINRRIIEQACRRDNLVISEQDIDEEVRDMAFNYLPILPNGQPNVEQWYKRATEEAGLSIPMYRKNVVVPILSLKRLTRKLIDVSEEDIAMSFEANYGKKVQCLAIFFDAGNQRKATEVWQMAMQHNSEESFGDLAGQYSFDYESRNARGIIPPIGRYCGHPELEKVAFELKPKEVSHLFQIEDSLIILYCTGYVEPLQVKLEDVRGELIADIFKKKQQIIIARYFEKLHEQAVFANYLTGRSQNPAMEKAMRDETNLQR